MFETITTNKTFKEINKDHDMICVEEVKALEIGGCDEQYEVIFYLDGVIMTSDYFKTEAEAIKFRNEIMGWNNDK